MNTKEKSFLGLLLIIFAIMIVMPLKSNASSIDVSTTEEFIEAVENSSDYINVIADIDLTDAGVFDITGCTINLNNNKIMADNFSLFFEGDNFTIQNGTFDAKGGSYALWIGDDGGASNVIIENITTIGGINIYNSTNVIIRNVNIKGTNYYAIWCDQGGQATVKSGNFTTEGVAVVGLSNPIYDTVLNIEGGTYKTNGKPLVLKNEDKWGKPQISGGTFDAPVAEEYCKEGFEPVEFDNGSYGVCCNHANTILKNVKEVTCTTDGYTGDVYCSNCNKLMENGETIYALGHTPSEWKFDKESHWKECITEGCGVIIPESKENHSNFDEEGKCKVCSYEPEKLEEPEAPTESETPEEPEKPEEPETKPSIKNVVDNKTNIKMEFEEGVVSADVNLEVNSIKEGTTYNNIKEVLTEVKKFVVFDINLLSKGAKVQPNGKVKISIPMPDDFDKTKLVVYRIEGKDKIQYDVKVIVIDNINYAQFETNHFSNYVLAEKTEEDTEPIEKEENTPNEVTKPEEDIKQDISKNEHKLDNEPKTGVIGTAIFVGIALIVSIVGYIICKKKMYK